MIKKTGKNFIKIKIFKNYLNRIKIFLERNIALSINPTVKLGFKFRYEIAAFAPAGPAPMIKTS